MKISYYDAFDLIAEDAGRLLSDLEKETTGAEQHHPNTTINAVAANLSTMRRPKKQRLKLRLLIAAIILLSTSTIALAVYHYDLFQDGAALVDDSNRDLVGKEQHGEATVIDKEGNIISGPPEVSLPTIEELIADSEIITSTEGSSFTPNSISYFSTSSEGTCSITPEVIFLNASMVVFTREDGSGWELSEGDRLIFEAEEYPSVIDLPGKGQTVAFMYICNGHLMNEDSVSKQALDLHFKLQAEQTGEYYICLVGASSDSISLKEGTIYTEQGE